MQTTKGSWKKLLMVHENAPPPPLEKYGNHRAYACDSYFYTDLKNMAYYKIFYCVRANFE
jgi:hypothetical protein